MNRQALIERLRGCYIAVPTIFDENLEVDTAAMRRHTRWLVERGVRTGNGMLLVAGAAGEFPTLTLDERLHIAEAVVAEVGGDVPVLVGAQSASTREAVQIAQHAARIGAAAVQVSPPFYYPPTDDDVFAYFQAIAEAADIGIIAYNTYWLGYNMTMPFLERLTEIENVVGLKWSAPDALDYERGYRFFSRRLAVIDNHLHIVYAHLLGAAGVNTHPSNFWPEWGVRLWDYLERQEYARAQTEVARLLWPFYDFLGDIGKITGGEGHLDKMGLELVGLKGGRNRPPTRPLGPEIKERLRRLFVEAGVPMP